MLHLSVMQDALVSAVKALSSDVNKSQPYVMLSANAVALTLRTQNGSTQAVRANVQEQGDKIVDFATFSKLVELSYDTTRKVRKDRYGNEKTVYSKVPCRIDLNDAGCFLEMKASGSVTNFKSFDSERENFTVPVSDFAPLGVIDASRLRAFLQHALKYVGHDENRPVLSGINVHIQGNCIQLATTDGFRLCTAQMDFYPASDAQTTFTLPASKALLKLASGDGCIHLSANASHVQFGYRGQFIGEDKEVVLAKMEGIYPDYRVIIPRNFHATFILDMTYKGQIKQLQKTLKRFAKCHSIHLVSHEGNLSITGKDENKNALTAVVEGQWELSHWDSHADVWLDPKFLSVALADMSLNESIRIGFQGKTSPVQVARQAADIVIMPMSAPRD